jgi:pyruvate,water dikinase
MAERAEITALARRRLEDLSGALAREVERSPASAGGIPPMLRHALRSRERIAEILKEEAPPAIVRERAASLLAADRARRARLLGSRVLAAEDCGSELWDGIGGKAAHLSELARLLGGTPTPPWFAITDAALEEVLGQGEASARARLEAILGDPASAEEEKAESVRRLFEEAPLPASLIEEILAARRRLAPEDAPVSVRSSGCEEDTETHAAAGEFESFLFVRGEEDLLMAVRRGWAGFWSARAIHRRAFQGCEALAVHGGLVVQTMARLRASGVLLTAHLAAGRMDEMVMNVGLGLGEGIVSGSVECDQVVLSKHEIGEAGGLRFRYRTGEKRAKIVPRPDGSGTMRIETLAHERLRPALEYREIEEIAGLALRLESSFGLPLDIEFGYEDERLWILQARPIARCAAILHESREIGLPGEERGEKAIPGRRGEA